MRGTASLPCTRPPRGADFLRMCMHHDPAPQMALLAAETKRDDLIKSLSGQAADQVSFDADLRQYRKRLEEQTAQLATLGDQLAEETRRKQALEKDLAAVSASLAAEQSLRADAEVQLRYVQFGSVDLAQTVGPGRGAP